MLFSEHNARKRHQHIAHTVLAFGLTLAVGTAWGANVTRSVPASGDFNGDGADDIILTGTRHGAPWFQYLQMNGSKIETRWGTRFANGYRVAAVGKISGGIMSEVIWTDDKGSLYAWKWNGRYFTSRQLPSYPRGWRLIGAADIDGDGTSDLLWINQTTHEFGYWLMQKGRLAYTWATPIPVGWTVIGVGYLNKDKRVDLIWQTTGPTPSTLGVWLSSMHGWTPVVTGIYAGGQGQLIAAYSATDTTLATGTGLWYVNHTGDVSEYILTVTSSGTYLSGPTPPSINIGVSGTFEAFGSFGHDDSGYVLWNQPTNKSVLNVTPLNGDMTSTRAIDFDVTGLNVVTNPFPTAFDTIVNY